MRQTCTSLYFNREGVGTGQKGDYVTIPPLSPAVPFNTDFTLEIKIKPVAHSGTGSLFSHLESTYSGFDVFISGDGTVRTQKRTGGLAALNGTTNVLDDKCHVVSLRRQGNQFGLFVDGSLQDTFKTWNVNFPAVNEYRVGNSLLANLSGPRGFNGVMRFVKIWDQALPVQDLARDLISPSDPALIAEWRFDERVGQHLTSTNGLFSAYLGGTDSTLAHDPRWLKSDSLCGCTGDSVPLSTHSPDEIDWVRLSPNPAGGTFVLHEIGFEALGREKEIEIYDLSGKLLWRQKWMKGDARVNFSERGMFLVKVSAIGQSQTIRLVNF